MPQALQRQELDTLCPLRSVLRCFQASSRVVLTQPAPDGGLVQSAYGGQLDGHRLHLVLSHQLTAIGRYVILSGSRRVYAVLSAPGHELARVAVVASDGCGRCVAVRRVQP